MTLGVINSPVLTHAGHFVWLQKQPGVAPYLVADSNGHLDSPGLSAFYMFFTMIILLQVEESDSEEFLVTLWSLKIIRLAHLSFFFFRAPSCPSIFSPPHPLQVLIPISLYVSIELVKIGQIFFIANDIDLYDEETDSCVQCKALNITEDLGQIEYIFSDKTGTLTENKMVFRRCSIMGTEYAHKENGNPLHCAISFKQNELMQHLSHLFIVVPHVFIYTCTYSQLQSQFWSWISVLSLFNTLYLQIQWTASQIWHHESQ